MYAEKEIAKLRKAWGQNVVPLTTWNQYQIYETNIELFLVSDIYEIKVLFNYENTKYVTISEIVDETNDWKNKITHFSIDKFFTPEMTIKILLNVIEELEHAKDMDSIERVHGMVN